MKYTIKFSCYAGEDYSREYEDLKSAQKAVKEEAEAELNRLIKEGYEDADLHVYGPYTTEVYAPNSGLYYTWQITQAKKVNVDLGCFEPEIVITIDVPCDEDAETYIDEFLDNILNENLRYNCDWNFIA